MGRITAWSGVMLALFGLPTVAAETVTDYDVMLTPAMQAPKASTATLTEITKAGSRQVAVGDFGVVIYRDEDAPNWQQAAVDTSVLLTAVSFANAEQGWAVGHHGVVMTTTDGGQSWQRQMDGFDFIELQIEHYKQVAEQLAEEVDNLPDNSSFSERDDLEFQLEEALFRAESAELAREEGPTKPFLDVLAIDSQTIFVAGAYGTLLRSTDGGQSWEMLDQRIENPDGLHINALTYGQGSVYAVGEGGQIFRSDDQGDSWIMLDSPYYGSFFEVFVDQSERVWVAGLRGNIFVAEHADAEFEPLAINDRVNINQIIDGPDGSVILVGNAGLMAQIFANGEMSQQRHNSGASLTDIITNADGSYTLVGQRGVLEVQADLSQASQ
ncbi:WD40/YVTN/BNR-like repeat-containing protein [Pseudidiomarina taiwanensis]|uniref:Photosynthesis system II assembly factor Ycf48/Hcf136-like domain-containing protein n=1 Tax=Pseudidiomarina taiwanensis TaxID=337250 RepID=A0A432ZN00_9GAMM|nr:YCF48-related protein [Pseudidiomarina taiwanensis]RUO79264.1 hypothetical protein CWI83_01755 [Pseudidiomarina taiwanensis]